MRKIKEKNLNSGKLIFEIHLKIKNPTKNLRPEKLQI